MAYKVTPLEFKNAQPCWALISEREYTCSCEDGYKTLASKKTYILECSNPLELSEMLSDGSVSAGESEGTSVFEVIGLYTSWEQFNLEVKGEEEDNKCELACEKEWASAVGYN